MIKSKNNKKENAGKLIEKNLSAFQIFILVVSIVAFTHAVSQGIGFVSAADEITDAKEIAQGLLEAGAAGVAGGAGTEIAKTVVNALTTSVPLEGVPSVNTPATGTLDPRSFTGIENPSLYRTPPIDPSALGGAAPLSKFVDGFLYPFKYFFGPVKDATVLSGAAGIGAILSSIVIAAGAAAAVAGAIAAITGASERNTRHLIGSAVVGGVGGTALALILILAPGAGPVGWAIGGFAAILTGIISALGFQNYSRDVFTYQAGLWQPASGGANCEKCNDLKYGCSLYQCKSYGKACELVNQGETTESCIWKDPLDRSPPIMQASDKVLQEMKQDLGIDLAYVDSEVRLPPELGVKINNNGTADGCIPAYSGVILGLDTNEPASCAISLERRATYDEMAEAMNQGSQLVYEHTLTIPSSANPSSDAANQIGWNVENGLHHEFFIRCKDANGNEAPANFIMEFCVDKSPDRAAPLISGTSLEDSYIGIGKTSTGLDVYTNEPASCRWDINDRDYEDMINTMICPSHPGEYLNPLTYTFGCVATLTGLKDEIDNVFYIRCKDKPWICDGTTSDVSGCEGENGISGESIRYKNTVSKKVTIKGSTQIAINKISINGKESGSLIRDSTDVVKIKLEVDTIGGAGKKGLVRCDYIISGAKYSFYNNGNPNYLAKNVQELTLAEGSYAYEVECTDQAGNKDTEQISFSVEVDSEPPIVVRVYHDSGRLRVVTNEKSECVYDTLNYDYIFDKGIKMPSSDGINHLTDWNTGNYLYVKCKDEFGKQPDPDKTTITVRPF
jgi:hypothetical protein